MDSHRPTAQWIELTTASFSHDPTGRSDRLDRFMGVEEGQFFLSHGGFVEGFTKYGEVHPPGHRPAARLVLPELPENYTLSTLKSGVVAHTSRQFAMDSGQFPAALVAVEVGFCTK